MAREGSGLAGVVSARPGEVDTARGGGPGRAARMRRPRPGGPSPSGGRCAEAGPPPGAPAPLRSLGSAPAPPLPAGGATGRPPGAGFAPAGRPTRSAAGARGASRTRSSCCFRRACRCRVVGTTAREPPLSGSLVRPLPGAPPDGGRDLVVTGAGRAPGRDALTRSRGARERQDACSRADHAVAPARRRRSGRSTPARRPGTAQSARRTHASASPAGA